MDIQDPAPEGGQRRGADLFHKPGQQHEIDPVGQQCVAHGAIQGLGFGMGAGAEMGDGDIMRPRAGQRRRVPVIADHDADLGGQSLRRRGPDQGQHIAAAPGDQDPESLHAGRTAKPSLPSLVAVSGAMPRAWII